MNIIVTGGAGFIGSALIRHLISGTDNSVLNIDKLTYAGNLESLTPVSGSKRYSFQKTDIVHRDQLERIFKDFEPDIVFHLAAESHVDKSITDPLGFVDTNILGTAVLLDVCYKLWSCYRGDKKNNFRFQHISTDEVFGSASKGSYFTESTAYDPSSPYSASKAASDHLVRAWNRTYQFPAIITNCSNNYGPYQFPEKLIPLTILKAIKAEKIPIYGNGMQVRDWLHVEDHIDALCTVMSHGSVGDTYNIGGHNEKTNLEVVRLICDLLDQKLGIPVSLKSRRDLITFVKDRPGHDVRYAIDASKMKSDLKWCPKYSFEQGLSSTVDWYFEKYKGIL